MPPEDGWWYSRKQHPDPKRVSENCVFLNMFLSASPRSIVLLARLLFVLWRRIALPTRVYISFLCCVSSVVLQLRDKDWRKRSDLFIYTVPLSGKLPRKHLCAPANHDNCILGESDVGRDNDK